MSNEPGHSRYW